MFRLFLIVLLGAGAWIYFTGSGQNFYKENFTPAPPPVIVDQRALQRVQGELNEVQAKLSTSRAELSQRETEDAAAAKKGKRTVFRTDKEMLRRSIQRLEENEARLKNELQVVQAGRPATVGR